MHKNIASGRRIRLFFPLKRAYAFDGLILWDRVFFLPTTPRSRRNQMKLPMVLKHGDGRFFGSFRKESAAFYLNFVQKLCTKTLYTGPLANDLIFRGDES